MANVNIKFNNKDYLLSCDDGQEESLKKLTSFLDKKYNELKKDLGNIGENKLLLITTIKLVDDLSKKFLEMKSLAIKYKDNKDIEIEDLNKDIVKFKKMIDESNSMYEAMLDKTTRSLE